MTLNFGSSLLRRDTLYDGGSVSVNLKNEFMDNGVYSESVNNTSGSIISIFDDDSTSYYYTQGGGSAATWVQFKMDEKVTFKTIYFTGVAYDGSGTGTGTFQIQGSDNGTDWTNLGSSITKTASNNPPAIGTAYATEVSYRYYRFYITAGGAAAATLGISGIKGVI